MDPISIAAGTIGAKFLEEAVKFLWAEAGKILDRYHKRKEGPIDDPAPAELKLPAKRIVDIDAVAKRKNDLIALRGILLAYQEGDQEITPDDPALVDAVQKLLAVVGEVYHQPVPGLVVKGEQIIARLGEKGKATNIDAEGVTRGTIDGKQTIIDNEGESTNIKLKF